MNEVAQILRDEKIHVRTRYYDPTAPKEQTVFPRFLTKEKYGAVAKTLICISGKQAYCLVLGYNARADLKKLARWLKVSRFQLAKPEQVTELTGYKIGSVSPVMPEKQLPTIFDQQLSGHTHLYLNGGQPGTQIRVPTGSLIEFLNGEVTDFASS